MGESTEEKDLEIAKLQSLIYWLRKGWIAEPIWKLGSDLTTENRINCQAVNSVVAVIERAKMGTCPDCGGPLFKPGYVHICPKIFPRNDPGSSNRQDT